MTNPPTSTLPCIKCGTVPAGATDDRAIAFTSTDRRNSAVFEPAGALETLEVVICDDCVRELARGRTIVHHHGGHTTFFDAFPARR